MKKKSIVQSLKGMAFTGVLATGLLFAGTGAFAAEQPGVATQVGTTALQQQ